jgi:hypothetical protein
MPTDVQFPVQAHVATSELHLFWSEYQLPFGPEPSVSLYVTQETKNCNDFDCYITCMGVKLGVSH